MALDLDAIRRWLDTGDRITCHDAYLLVDEIDRLRAAVALHHLLDVAPVPGVVFPCSHCGHPWPCPTVTTAEGGDQ